MIWIIALLSFTLGAIAHSIYLRHTVSNFYQRSKKRQKRDLELRIQLIKTEIIYRMNHAGIRPISATSQGLAGVIMWGLNHYTNLLQEVPKPWDIKIRIVIQGLLDIRNQELTMLVKKMEELRLAIEYMLKEENDTSPYDQEENAQD